MVVVREIKFRAWDGRYWWLVNWVDFKDGKLTIIEGHPLINGKAAAKGSLAGDEIKAFVQYTGLKDKNGVEIYEGDVLLREWDGMSQNTQPLEGDVHVYDYFTVEWKNQGFNFRNRKVEIQNFNGKPWMTYEYDNPMTFSNWLNKEPSISALEVIGNIYENPELLEKSS